MFKYYNYFSMKTKMITPYTEGPKYSEKAPMGLYTAKAVAIQHTNTLEHIATSVTRGLDSLYGGIDKIVDYASMIIINSGNYLLETPKSYFNQLGNYLFIRKPGQVSQAREVKRKMKSRMKQQKREERREQRRLSKKYKAEPQGDIQESDKLDYS